MESLSAAASASEAKGSGDATKVKDLETQISQMQTAALKHAEILEKAVSSATEVAEANTADALAQVQELSKILKDSKAQSLLDASMLTARKAKIGDLEDSLRKMTNEADLLQHALTEAKEREDELLEKNARYMKQQISLDEYKAKAQDSIKLANQQCSILANEKHEVGSKLSEIEKAYHNATIRMNELEEAMAQSTVDDLKNQVIDLESQLSSSQQNEVSLKLQIEAMEKAAVANAVITNAKDAIEKRNAIRNMNKNNNTKNETNIVVDGNNDDNEVGVSDENQQDKDSMMEKEEEKSNQNSKLILHKKVETFKRKCEDLEEQVNILSRQLETCEEQRQRAIAMSIAANTKLKKAEPDSRTSPTSSLQNNVLPAVVVHQIENDTDIDTDNNNNKSDQNENETLKNAQEMNQDASSANLLSSLTDDQLFFHAKLHEDLRTLQTEKARLLRELDEERGRANRAEAARKAATRAAKSARAASAPKSAEDTNAYLKHCVLTFIISSDDQGEVSTRQRLLPVIAELLRFSENERSTATLALVNQKSQSGSGDTAGGALLGRALGLFS